MPSRVEATDVLQKLIDTKHISGLSGGQAVETELYKFNVRIFLLFCFNNIYLLFALGR